MRRLIGSGRAVRAVLVDATQHAALADVLDDLDAPVYLGSRTLIEATLGYAFHRGAIASAARDDGLEPAALLAASTRIAVLEGIGDLENLGSIFRNAAAFGIDGVLLDPRTADPFARRPIRVSMGHTLTVPWARARAWPDALADARAAGFTVAALTPGDDSDPDRPAAGDRPDRADARRRGPRPDPRLAGGDRPARADPDGAGRRLAQRRGRQRHRVPPRRCDNRAMSEGHIEVPGGRVWYERLGGGSGTPVLTLHGGPGAAHYYLRPFAERLAENRPVILYDQLGCGLSEKPDDTSLWTFDRFVAELDAVRAALGLDHCHLFGQSWGGWLAIEYLCRGTTGIDRVILASTSASIRQFTAEARRLIEALPEPARTTLIELGDRGEYDSRSTRRP